MLRKTMVALATVLALGTTAVSTTAFARAGGGGGYGGGGGGHFGGGHFGGGQFAGSRFGGGFRGGFNVRHDRSNWAPYSWSYCEWPYPYRHAYGYNNECY